jgi:hypothetical protein
MGCKEVLVGYHHIYLLNIGYTLACWPLDENQIKAFGGLWLTHSFN